MDDIKTAMEKSLNQISQVVIYFVIFIVAQLARMAATEFYEATSGESYIVFIVVLFGLLNIQKE